MFPSHNGRHIGINGEACCYTIGCFFFRIIPGRGVLSRELKTDIARGLRGFPQID